MVKIQGKVMDIVLSVDEHSSVDRLMRKLNLDINEIMVISNKLFLQRFIQSVFEDLVSIDSLHDIEEGFNNNRSFFSFKVHYKCKVFGFNFIITEPETMVVNNPFKGEQVFSVGIKQITV